MVKPDGNAKVLSLALSLIWKNLLLYNKMGQNDFL